MKTDFSANLALLCSYRSTIAETCRSMGMNRQQFNKYLSGQTRPSRRNMRMICDFFGVSEAEILLDPAQFEQIIGLRPDRISTAHQSAPQGHIEELYRHSQPLDKYVGYYYRYFFSFGNKGFITRSLARIYAVENRYYWKNIEILRTPDTGPAPGLNKYSGALFYLADRIYLIEYETLDKKSITQATFYPSHQHRLTRLVGIQTGGPTRRGRKPGASKVALDYLGKRIDIKKALAETGLFRADSGKIPGDLVQIISNTIPDDGFVLEVDEP